MKNICKMIFLRKVDRFTFNLCRQSVTIVTVIVITIHAVELKTVSVFKLVFIKILHLFTCILFILHHKQVTCLAS